MKRGSVLLQKVVWIILSESKTVKASALISDSKTDDRDRLFASTCWTAVFDAAQSSLAPARAQEALSDLCARYWRPLYLFLRRQGFNSEDAQDLTQGFFVDLINTRAYARADPTKGRFRSFLLGAMKHFVADAHDHSHAKKRGGDAIRVPITSSSAGGNRKSGWSLRDVQPGLRLRTGMGRGTCQAGLRSARPGIRACGKNGLVRFLEIALIWCKRRSQHLRKTVGPARLVRWQRCGAMWRGCAQDIAPSCARK